MNCNFCGKTNDQVSYMIVGLDAYICDECVKVCVVDIFNHIKYNKVKDTRWIEASSIDPRDNKVYFARVNLDDYDMSAKAYHVAKQRADYLALRGYHKEIENAD